MRRLAAILLWAVTLAAGDLIGQDPPRDSVATGDSVRVDTLAPRDSVARSDSLAAESVRAGQPIDTASAARLGLPSAPSRSLPAADSIIEALLRRRGYQPIRYRADSVTLFAERGEIFLDRQVLVERGSTTIEADSIRYLENDCLLFANGDPKLFDPTGVLIGEGMQYDTCAERGRVANALTDFNRGGVTWFLRGQLAVDSSSTRIFAAGGNVTSCDLPHSHYHFRAGKVKWINERIFVARPAVLYIRDIPIMWLPFVFQDIRSGRRSGILVPRFGINDLIRPNSGYQRHINNLGYYWAMSDYTDLSLAFDWYSGSYTQVTGEFNYRWLNRFVTGGLRLGRQAQVGGGTSLNLQWSHRQNFSSRASLVANVNYASNTRIVERNAVDPTTLTANIDSRLNYNRTFDWGRLDIGGSRSQSVTDPSIRQTLPTTAVAPAPIGIGNAFTWSPSLQITNTQNLNQSAGMIPIPGTAAGPDSLELLTDQRRTDIRFNTPLRIGSWNWTNDIVINDFRTDQRSVQSRFSEDSSATIQTTFGEDFSTGIDWNTGFTLPSLFRRTWRFQPSVSIQNATSGPFLLRNRNTGGRFVSQGKRLAFGLSASPTVFGFFPGLGPIARIRHSISPTLRWNFTPAAGVPDAYALALDPSGATVGRRSEIQHRISVGLSQVFEGKLRSPEGDTLADPRDARKVKVLQISTGSITYDFEQAKDPERTGWTTQTLRNTLTSDLLRGFSMTLTHDLWDGPVGMRGTSLDPFLQNVSVRASISASTIGALLGIFGIGGDRPELTDMTEELPPETELEQVRPDPPLGARYSTLDQFGPDRGGGRRGFTLSANYDLSRRRPDPSGAPAIGNRQNLGLSLAFSPTRHWSVAWNTAYNLEAKEFEQHVVRLDRDLHRWRASFSFVQLANGNFVFNFFVNLADQPEIKFEYDQQTVDQ